MVYCLFVIFVFVGFYNYIPINHRTQAGFIITLSHLNPATGRFTHAMSRAPTTLKSEGEVTSLSGADKREVRDNREKW